MMFPVFEKPDWFSHGNCWGGNLPLDQLAANNKQFFPERGDSTAAAHALCVNCPVQKECHEYGMKENYGRWGDVCQDERRLERRNETRSALKERRAKKCTGTAACGRRGCKNVTCVARARAMADEKNAKQREVRARERATL